MLAWLPTLTAHCLASQVVVIALAVALVVGQVHSQRVFTDRAEYERQKAVYDMQKAKYDEFQALTKVPLLAGYDLITKGRDADQAPGKAEQLLPNYTGEKVKFQVCIRLNLYSCHPF